MSANAMNNIGYGLYVVTATDGSKDNGCVVNTFMQVTNTPNRVILSVNKQNYTHDMIVKTKKFNISVLTTSAPFSLFEHFGFQSGRDTDKFDSYGSIARSKNGLVYLTEYTNAVISGEVISSVDLGTHTLFTADVTETEILNEEPTLTYAFYHQFVKPRPKKTKKKGWRCRICGYVYEGDELPADFTCPLCLHGAEDFEPIPSEEPQKDTAMLAGSRTEANLAEAFAGESMARNKYTYFAEQARRDGYEAIADIFEETALNEREHAKLWFKELNGGVIPTTEENLKAAAEGENGEWTGMYPRMEKEAEEEGFSDIAALFRRVGDIERTHENRYRSLLKQVEDDKVFTAGEETVWICKVCGYEYKGAAAPQVCPICQSGQSYFEKKLR